MNKKNFAVYEASCDLGKKWFVYYTDVNGKRIRKYGDINKEKTVEGRRYAAELLINALQLQLKNGIVGGGRDLIKNKVEHFLRKSANKWSKKTFSTYSSKWRMFTKYAQDSPVTIELLSDFFSHLEGRGLSSTTLRAYKFTLSELLELACEKKGLLLKVGKYRKKSESFRAFTQAQAGVLLKQFAKYEPELHKYATLMMYCFIRPGELLKLRVQDIDFETHQICVSGIVAKNDRKAFAQIPKAIREKVFEWWGDSSPGDYLFRQPNENKPVSAKFFPLRHQTFIGKMGYDLDLYKPYSWKHTGAVMYIRNGGRVKSLQLLMRHHSLQMTDEYLKSLGINDMDDSDDVMPSL